MTDGQKFRLKAIVIMLFIGLFVTYLMNRCEPDPKPAEPAISAKPAIWKDKDSATHVVTAPIIASNPKEFLKIQAQDKIIQDLQKEVTTYKRQLGKKGSVTVVQGTSIIDTVYIATPAPAGFIWKDSIYNKFLNWDYSVKSDSTNKAKVSFKLKTIDDLVIINRIQSNGWFKGHTVVTEVINKNPYSKTVNSATFNIDTKVPKRPWSIGPYVGYGFGDGITPNVSVGIGLQYGFIRF